ncbi:MAG: type IV pilus modification PilV family protein [Planctomycetota bacterium]
MRTSHNQRTSCSKRFTDVAQRGITLVETVIAVLVLGIAVPPLVTLFGEVSTQTVDDSYQRVALIYAESMLEEIVSKEFEDPQSSTGSFGTEEGLRANFDDIDDFDGLSNSPPKHIDGSLLDQYAGFTRSVIIDNVTAEETDPASAESDGSTDFKRIRVTVAWTSGRGGEVTLATLRSQLSTAGPTGLLDVPASVATIRKTASKKFALDLVNISGEDLVIESFEISEGSSESSGSGCVASCVCCGGVGTCPYDCDDRHEDEDDICDDEDDLDGDDEDDCGYDGDDDDDDDDPETKVKKLRLDSKQIWSKGSGIWLPTGITDLNKGSTSDRTIDWDDSPKLEFQVKEKPEDSMAYTLTLYFTDGRSSTLPFTVDW